MHNRKKTPDRIRFGKVITNKREELGLSKKELANLAGINYDYLRQVENGERNIALENIILLANALGCHPGDLFKQQPTNIAP